VSGDWLDAVLIVVAVIFAFTGYRQGFLVGICSFVGFLGGAVIGAKIAPSIAGALVESAQAQAVVALVTVFTVATLGQVMATTIGAALRRRLLWRPFRVADSAAGAVVSIISVAIVAWLVASAVVHSPFRSLSKEVQDSYVLQQIDDVMPVTFRDFFAAFRRLVGENSFPPVFSGLGGQSVAQVPKPDPRVAHSPAVQRAEPEIVKVLGFAPACSRRIEGSGFLYATNRIMTNAHVVAGVKQPTVTLADGGEVDATVVLYDPKRDVAVLSVPGVGGRPLEFAGAAHKGDNAVIAGYPQNAPRLIAVAARVRGTIDASSPDIYQRGSHTREIYAVRGIVRPGNSGGPLLAPGGKVYGVVFAAATDDNDTGYALTAKEVAGDAEAGARATAKVGTGGCD